MIGILVRETILLLRAYRCEHDWKRVSDTEEQCTRCTIIATAEGKKNLTSMAARYLGLPACQR